MERKFKTTTTTDMSPLPTPLGGLEALAFPSPHIFWKCTPDQATSSVYPLFFSGKHSPRGVHPPPVYPIDRKRIAYRWACRSPFHIPTCYDPIHSEVLAFLWHSGCLFSLLGPNRLQISIKMSMCGLVSSFRCAQAPRRNYCSWALGLHIR